MGILTHELLFLPSSVDVQNYRTKSPADSEYIREKNLKKTKGKKLISDCIVFPKISVIFSDGNVFFEIFLLNNK